MNTLIYTTEIENFSEKQMNARKNLFLGLADTILRGEIPERKAQKWTEVIEENLTFEDLKRMSIEEVHKFAQVCDDISMTDFFSYRELAEAGYLTLEDCFDAEYEVMYL